MEGIRFLQLLIFFLSILKVGQVGALAINCIIQKIQFEIGEKSLYALWLSVAYILTFIFF
jgi:hypothetical protein